MIERIDKIISSQGQLSRSQVKKLIKEKRVTADGAVVRDSSERFEAKEVHIEIDGKDISYKKYVYLMLNKPKGYVSSTEERNQKTVLELVPEEFSGRKLFPAGRLDKDTTGFLLITDDGDFAHRILSPKNHIEKTYTAEIEKPLTKEEKESFERGLILSDGTVLLSARVKMLTEEKPYFAEVVIKEGKYHQIKRMFASLGNKVLELKRIKMGKLFLDEELAEGEIRELTKEELSLIEEK